MGIIAWIVLGLIAGAIAKAIMPGRDPGGILVTMLIGIVGAFLGGFLGSLITGTGLTGFSLWRTSVSKVASVTSRTLADIGILSGMSARPQPATCCSNR